jgi:cytoskeletal protein CcmA (bactofilin family)
MATRDPATASGTVIGPSIHINGKVRGDEDLTIRGRVEGEITLTRTLVVESSGIVKAQVNVRSAIVSGVVVGNLHATESVEIAAGGRMVGDIHAPRVILADGASFRGRVDMGNAQPAVRTESPNPVIARITHIRAPKPPPPPGRQEVRLVGEADSTPPAPPTLASGAKKKVVLRRKGH